jgi:hypothetical protein
MEKQNKLNFEIVYLCSICGKASLQYTVKGGAHHNKHCHNNQAKFIKVILV